MHQSDDEDIDSPTPSSLHLREDKSEDSEESEADVNYSIFSIQPSIPPVVHQSQNFSQEQQRDVPEAQKDISSVLETLSMQPELVKKMGLIVARAVEMLEVIDSCEGVNAGVYRVALVSLLSLSNQDNARMVKAIENIVPSIHKCLGNRRDSKKAILIISEISKKQEFAKTIEGLVPNVLALLKNKNSDVSDAVLCALPEFVKHPELVQAIGKAIPDVQKCLGDRNRHIRMYGITAIAEISKQHELAKTIESILPEILPLLKDDNQSVRGAVLRSFTEFLKQPELVHMVGKAIPYIHPCLNSPDYDTRKEAASVICEISKHQELVKMVENIIPEVLMLLKDDTWLVHGAVLQAIPEFLKQAELAQAAVKAIPDIHKCLRFGYREAITTTARISQQEKYAKMVESLVPDVLALLTNSNMRDAASHALQEFLKQPDLAKAVESKISYTPDDGQSLDEEFYVAILRCFAELSAQTELVEPIAEMMPCIFAYLKSDNLYVRRAAVDAIVEFRKQERLIPAIEVAMPSLLAALDSSGWKARVAVLDALAQFPVSSETAKILESAVPYSLDNVKNPNPASGAALLFNLIHFPNRLETKNVKFIGSIVLAWLDSHDPGIRITALNTLRILSHYEDFVEIVENTVPRILDWLNESNVRPALLLALLELSKQRT
ncbi:hypothetical protein GALMADRAFT_231750 [Galerina marginata CBS 339.88]|uniref:Clathrin/coatomer adaptor adaptin-like N-terminal domain-containing protein n=1 Tax=Galerina marginata (strain CBS 339.88) TaxID=685588 RepID=A0A067SJF6_GALM3|nr:hypothetical protein GALMADRAFT_231750 [Galerina marginata CBS 339.88]